MTDPAGNNMAGESAVPGHAGSFFHSKLERGLRHLARAVFLHPRWFFYPQLALFIVCLFYTIHGLEKDFSRDNLVGPNKRYHQIYLQYKKEFATQDDLVAVVESEDPEKNRQFVERLGGKLEAENRLFTDVFYKGDLKLMGNKALLFLSEDDLQALHATLKDYRPFIQNFTQADSLTALFRQINRQFSGARREQNEENESMIRALPALERIVEQARDSLDRPGTPVSPGINALFNGGQEAESGMYITFAEGKFYLVTARAADPKRVRDAVARLRELMEETRREVPGVNAGLTGEPVLEVDEMDQSAADTAVASAVSFVLVFLIIIYGYGRISRRIKADICLGVGMAYTMGFTTLVIGHLNILTITFAPILIGLAIDFGVHLIARYEEELRRGRTEKDAMEKAMVETGMGIVTGCLTTAGAFLAMGATSFRGIQEMGVICGAGVLICLVPMMTLLPVLLLRERRKEIQAQETAAASGLLARAEEACLKRPAAGIAVLGVVSVLAWSQASRVGFDYNLLHMQSDGLPAVQYEKKLIHAASKSVLFGAVIATNLHQAAGLETRLRELPAVASVESLIPFLNGDQTRKLELVGDIKKEVSGIRFKEPGAEPVGIDELSRILWSLQGYLGMAGDTVEQEDPELYKQLLSLRNAIQELRKAMLKNPDTAAVKLAAYQRAFFWDIRNTFESLQNQDNRSRLQVQDLPASLRNRFVGKTGKLLLQVYPKDDAWERGNQEKFVRELRSVADTVTGTPVQLYEYTSLLKQSYQEATVYSLIAIAILAFLHFRSVVCVFLALLPVGAGFLWMTGMMGLCGISFNPANIMTLPLIVGIGVTNGIHILNRFAEERHPRIMTRSTGKAVVVSGLTTVVGFGSLILAKHQGISSLGLVMATGVAACMIVGLIFLPMLLTLLLRAGWTIKKPSGDLPRPTLGPEELR